LQKAVELDPNRGEALVFLGKCQAHMGLIDQAIANLRKGVKLDPNFSTGWAELGSACEGTGKLDDALAAYKEFVARNPNSAETPTVKDLIRDLSRELQAEKEALLKDSAARDGTDYFMFATSKGVSHWDKTRMPLKVYVNSPIGKQNYRPAFSQALERAFDKWQSTSGGRVSFVRVASPKEANIEVNWSDSIHDVASLAEHGETRTQLTSEGVQHATINLLTIEDPNDQDKLTDNLMFGVCLHEVGHALGLRGHSNDPNDIMFYCVPTADKEFDLSNRDIATMARLYDTAENKNIAVTIAANEMLGDDQKSALNNEGVTLMNSGNVEGAIKKFEDSLAQGTKDNPASKNLALALNNLAIKYAKANDYPRAEPLLKRALELVDDNDAHSHLAILQNYVQVLTLQHKNSEAAKFQTALAELKKK
jgi:tetratricopeptide (TPR) repeat protein